MKVKHQTSNIKHQTSNIKHQASNIKHQTSSIKHQTSNIEHIPEETDMTDMEKGTEAAQTENTVEEEPNALVSEDSPQGETDTTNYVSFLEGLDKRTTEELWKAGFRNVESVASADPEEIAEKCPISISLCKGIVVIARTKLKDEEAMLKMLNGQKRKNPSDLSEVSGDVADGAEEEFPMDTISRRQLARMIVKELF